MSLQFLRLPEVCARTGMSRAWVYAQIKAGRFPSPVPLGSPYAVGWIESEISDWCDKQITAARGDPVEASAMLARSRLVGA